MTAFYNENDSGAAAWLRELIKRNLIAPGVVDERSIEDIQPHELEPYTQVHFFAGIGVWSYALRLAGWPDDRPVWTGSCPCFTAGVLVLTKGGLLPIENVRVGCDVWTHAGRWKPVLRVGSEIKEVGDLKGQAHFGIRTTADHPFWSINRTIRETHLAGANVRLHDVSAPEWTPAAAMPGKWWALPARYPSASTPRTEGLPAEDFAFLAGLYIGDGWVGSGAREGYLMLGVNAEKRDAVRARLPDVEFKEYEMPTGVRLVAKMPVIARILRRDFGSGAAGKTLPAWLMGAPLHIQHEFLSGWDLTDGTRKESSGSKRLTTVSRNLAITGRMLLAAMGYSVSLRKIKTASTTVIEGRTVNQRDYYTLNRSTNERYKIERNDAVWFRVKNYTPCAEKERVYNIEVADDNSYTADGIIVHNCQPFSSAGKGGGFADERHLWPAFHYLIKERRPDVIFGEQVASKDGLGWIDLVRDDVEGEGYTIGALDTSSALTGAPHIRQRLRFVAERLEHNQSDGRNEWWPEPSERGAACGRGIGVLGHTRRAGLEGHGQPGNIHAPQEWAEEGRYCPASSLAGGMADAPDFRLHGRGASEAGDEPREIERSSRFRAVAAGASAASEDHGFWSSADWLFCRDGKWRPAQSGAFPLAHGSPARVVRLRGYGNAVDAQATRAFIEAYLSIEAERR